MEFRRHGGGRFVAIVLAYGVTANVVVRADYPNKVLDSQPFGMWRMNDSGSETALNSGTAGPALNGTYHNGESGAAGPTELPDGTPLLGMGFRNTSFDVGSNESYIEVAGSPLSGLSQFTLSGWFSPRSLDHNEIGIVGQRDAIELGFSQPDQLQVRTAGGGTLTWDVADSAGVGIDQWFHLAAVGTGSGLQLFVNGAQVASGGTAVATNYGVSNQPLRIGQGVFAPSGDQYHGPLDEIAFWQQALSAETIASQFQAALGANRPGDFDGNDRFDLNDVNPLQRAIYEGTDDAQYDVSGNGVVDEDDLSFWVRDIAFTYVGDADLNGEFNSSDFVLVFQKGEYEDNVAENSTWDEGDWNADLDFTSSDFVAAFQDGGFEVGPAAVAVPEPVHGLGIVGLILLFAGRRSADH
jgi:hypothetical protein